MNYAIKLAEIMSPITNPRMIELMLFTNDSYIVSLMIWPLFIPIALRTPNSHIESLMFADIETMS